MQDILELKEAARDASKRAYAPYSGFPVGAAVISSTGRIFTGCNVENASYGLAVCAERVAVFSLIASGEREITALALFTPTPSAVSPCGACRQVLAEFGENIRVFSGCEAGAEREWTLLELLPDGFSLCSA